MPDLFTEGTPATPQTPSTPTQPDSIFSSKLAEIKDETGRQKYDTPEKALDALKHSQNYIPELKGQLTAQEAEIARLKSELEQRASVEELIQKTTQPPQQEPVVPTTTGLGQEDVASLIENALLQKDQKALRDNNIKQVSDVLVGKFADKAQEVLASKAKELGMDLAAMEELAATSPKVVLTMFDSQTPAPSTPPIASGQRGVMPPHQESVKDRVKAAGDRLMQPSAKSRSQVEVMRQIRDAVYAKHGITE